MKKLTGKTSWFKQRRETKTAGQTGQVRTGGPKRPQCDKQDDRPTIERRPDTVMFVERTPGGVLINKLRAQEKELNKFSRKKVKMVE